MSAPFQQGQPPWPDNQQRPDRPPPIQFHNDGQAPRGSQALAWTLRIVGLIAVAVISGVVWWYIVSDNGNGSAADGGGANGQQQSGGAYDFTPKLDSPKVDNDCGNHAYGKTQQFFVDHPCQQLTRAAYTTKADGRTVYTSVSVVAFDNAQDATDLQALTQADQTGNVNDLVREGVLKVDGLKTLSADGGYASEVQGNRITIVESDYDPKAGDGGSEDELDDVSNDALRLGADITANG